VKVRIKNEVFDSDLEPIMLSLSSKDRLFMKVKITDEIFDSAVEPITLTISIPMYLKGDIKPAIEDVDLCFVPRPSKPKDVANFMNGKYF